MSLPALDPLRLLRPRRRITGLSAILLPFRADGAIDWPAFQAHVARTAAAGLTPAVNMDTGYVNLLDAATRRAALAATRTALGGGASVAAASVGDRPREGFRLADYLHAV